MKIKNRQAIELLEVLNRIPGLNNATKGQFALVKNNRLLTELKADVDAHLTKEQQRLFAKEELTTPLPNSDPRVIQYKQIQYELLEQEVEFTPYMTTLEDLNFDQNNQLVSNGDWAKLFLFVKEEDIKEEKKAKKDKLAAQP